MLLKGLSERGIASEMYRILIPELNRSLSGQVSKIAQVLFMELDGKSRFTNAVVASGVR